MSARDQAKEAARIDLSSSLLAGRFSELERHSYEPNVRRKGSLVPVAQTQDHKSIHGFSGPLCERLLNLSGGFFG